MTTPRDATGPDAPAAPPPPGTWSRREAPRPDPRRTAYNWIYRVLGDRSRAKALVAKLPAAALEGDPAAVLAPVRALIAADLSPAELASTIYGRPGEVLMDLPAISPLPEDDRSVEGLDPKERFPSPVRGVLELCLVDRIPLATVAQGLGVSPDLLGSFLAHAVDLMGELSSISLPLGASHLSHVILEEIVAHQQGTPPPGGADEASAVRRLRERCRRVIFLMAFDRRILSMTSERLVKSALAAPPVKVAKRGSWMEIAFRGLMPRARGTAPEAALVSEAPPGEEPGAEAGPGARLPWRPFAMMAGAIVVMAVVFVAGRNAPAPVQRAHVKGGDASRVLGAFSVAGVRREPLLAGSRIEAPAAGPLAVSFHVGASLRADPSSVLSVKANEATLERGACQVWTEKPLKTPFIFRVRAHVAELADGLIEVRSTESGRVHLTMRRGRASLSDAARQTRELQEGDQLDL